MPTYTLNFESQTSVSASEAWNWITSFSGISSEIKPLLNMTAPKGVESIQDVDFKLGQPLFRSTLLLFGAIPVDYSRLTVIKMEEGQWFVEESPMGSMKLWRHERYVVDSPGGAVIRDCITFEPRFARAITAWCVEVLFRHRHRMILRYLRQPG